MAKSFDLFRIAIVSLCLGSIHPVSAAGEEAVDFERDVWPILERNCVVCHGTNDQFNDLRLDSKAAILEGGKHGKVLVAGEPDESPMYVRPSLPSDDLDVMPAEGDPLSKDQVDILRRWIAEGADFGDWTGSSAG